uniref:HMG1/2-like protein n=3 Tax=Rhizophora mucronata TaxID=61149 RepID=A0A2P2KM31_RHIMU
MKGGKSKADTTNNATDVRLKRKGAGTGRKAAKKAKDPNKPKRPPSAFFVFMEEFRQQYKEKHPDNKSVAAVGKAGGDKWKSMSDADKAPYVAGAEKRKTEYNKHMAAYNKRLAGGTNVDDESDKSKSEVNDGRNEEEESGEEDEDDE